MADTKLRLPLGISGWTVYTRLKNESGQIWNSTTSAYVSYVLANIAHFDLATPEIPAGSGDYEATMPAGSAAGNYSWSHYRLIGADPASSDPLIGSGSGWWDGDTYGNVPGVAAISSKLNSYDELLNAGTVDDPSPTATTFIGSANFSDDSNLYRTCSVCFTDGDLQGAKSPIIAYNGETKRFTVSGFAKAPADGDAFKVI